jgi:hypothetical protein
MGIGAYTGYEDTPFVVIFPSVFFAVFCTLKEKNGEL